MTLEARVIPCLLLRGDGFVKTKQFEDPVYVGDPVNVLSIFNSFEVDEIVLLSIASGVSRVPADLGLLLQLAEECFIPMAYGGGLGSVDTANEILSAGYEKVIFTTAVAERPEVVRDAAREFGNQAVVAGVDVRGDGVRGEAFVRSGTQPTGVTAVEWAERAEELGAGEILLTSIDREGTMRGFDLELIAAVVAAVNIPVVAHGGAGRRAQLGAPVLDAGASAVAAGSLFVFQGPARGVLINYPPRAQLVRLMGGE